MDIRLIISLLLQLFVLHIWKAVADKYCPDHNATIYWPLEKCYWRSPGYLKEEESQKYCQSTGGYLATIDTSAVMQFLQKVITFSDEQLMELLWLGTRHDGVSWQRWDGSAISWTNWDPDFTVDTNLQCITVSLNTWLWRTRPCGGSTLHKTFALCEIAARDSYCHGQDGAFYSQMNKCFWTTTTTGVTFFQGQFECGIEGGYPATVYNSDVMDFLHEKVIPSTNTRLWLGMNDFELEGRWVSWMGQAITYYSWKDSTRPRVPGDDYDCVMLKDTYFHDRMCASDLKPDAITLCESNAFVKMDNASTPGPTSQETTVIIPTQITTPSSTTTTAAPTTTTTTAAAAATTTITATTTAATTTTTDRTTVASVIPTTSRAITPVLRSCPYDKKPYVATIDLENKLSDMKRKLAVSKKDTSKSRRKRTCATDSRPSAKSVGILGIVLCSLFTIFILLLDLQRLFM